MKMKNNLHKDKKGEKQKQKQYRTNSDGNKKYINMLSKQKWTKYFN